MDTQIEPHYKSEASHGHRIRKRRCKQLVYLQIGFPGIGSVKQAQFELVKAIGLVTGGPHRHCKKGAMLVINHEAKTLNGREDELDWRRRLSEYRLCC